MGYDTVEFAGRSFALPDGENILVNRTIAVINYSGAAPASERASQILLREADARSEVCCKHVG
jgi:hypothetical protein